MKHIHVCRHQDIDRHNYMNKFVSSLHQWPGVFAQEKFYFGKVCKWGLKVKVSILWKLHVQVNIERLNNIDTILISWVISSGKIVVWLKGLLLIPEYFIAQQQIKIVVNIANINEEQYVSYLASWRSVARLVCIDDQKSNNNTKTAAKCKASSIRRRRYYVYN